MCLRKLLLVGRTFYLMYKNDIIFSLGVLGEGMLFFTLIAALRCLGHFDFTFPNFQY